MGTTLRGVVVDSLEGAWVIALKAYNVWRAEGGVLCLSVEILALLIMDWMQWSLISPPSGSAWPAVSQDFNETLALTTALGYSLFACETCMLNCCFDPVSMSSRQEGFTGPDPVSLYPGLSCLKRALSGVVGLRSLVGRWGVIKINLSCWIMWRSARSPSVVNTKVIFIYSWNLSNKVQLIKMREEVTRVSLNFAVLQ